MSSAWRACSSRLRLSGAQGSVGLLQLGVLGLQLTHRHAVALVQIDARDADELVGDQRLALQQRVDTWMRRQIGGLLPCKVIVSW